VRAGIYRTLGGLLLLPLLACGRTDGGFLGAPTAAPPGGGVPADAGLRVDAGGAPDAGAPPDAGPAADLRLGQALSCQLDTEQALRAAARFVACTGESTMAAIMDAHEGLALGSPEPYTLGIAGIPSSCRLWQCAASASDCAEFTRCFRDSDLGNRRCEAGRLACAGDVLAACIGDVLTPHIDCAQLGARCEEGACVRDGCRFGNGENPARCDPASGALVLCDLELDCTAWRGEEARCASFYVQGEVPVPWCSPGEVGSVAGAYERPVECADGVVEFETMSGRRHRVACRDLGYRGCDDEGCR
jgi:hypothetical protein